ncbi:MAG: TolC family protein [Candidatus Omnitrophica bacterium]|nr:TolC family protein [Candidatus Omnitrophota bacterium]
MKIFYLVLSILIVSVGCVQAEGVGEASLDLMIDEALNNNPQVQAVYNEWKAAEHKVGYVSGLPDPMVSYGYFGDNVETRVGPQEHKYGASLKVPFPGKLSLKGKAQSTRAATLKEKYEATKRELIKNVTFVYYDIFWVDKAIRVVEEEKSILEGLESVAQRRYESNMTPQQDVIKVQVEISKLIDRLFILRHQREGLQAKMNSLLDRAKGTKLMAIADTETAEFVYRLDQLHEMAQESRQELLAADLEVERAEYEKSLAKLDYFPDFTFGVDYIQVGDGQTTQPNDGDDAWMGKVAVNIPIWFDKLGAQVNEKKAALEASKKRYENAENNVAYEVEDIYYKIIAYKDIVSLYRTALVPQTEQAFEAARTGYESGEVDFLNWLDAERILLQTRLAHYKSIVDYHKSIAYLERVVGKDL